MQINSSRIRSFLLLVALAILTINSFGQVTVSTSTLNIPADRSVGGTSESFTPVPSIVISDNAAGDFGAGSNRRFRVTLPAGWVFNDSAPYNVIRSGTNVTTASGTFNGNNTILTILYTATGTNASDNAITIAGLQVKPTSGVAGGAAYITRTAVPAAQSASEAVINGFPVGYQLVELNITPGNFTKLQVLLPGQVNAPGTVNGYTGTPTVQQAGTSIPVTVNAVDNYFNIVTAAPADQISITSNVNGLMPSPTNLSSGMANISVQLNQSGSGATITAQDITNGGITSSTSRPVTISAQAFSKLQVLLPGETADPGSITGKIGTPTDFVAGTASQVTVRAVDQYWNLVTGIGTTSTVNLSSTNASTPTITPGAGTATLSNAGIRNFNVTYNLAGETPTLTAVNQTTPSITSNTSPQFNVVGGNYAKLQILLPGEIGAPGTTSGKVGSPSPVVAGTAVSVTINAVDSQWNIISTINNPVNVVSSRNAQIPSPVTLVNGSAIITAVLTTVGTQSLSASDTVTSLVGNSSNISVTAGSYSKLLVILPGETHNPGSLTGKSGSPSDRVSAQQFQITVLSVDEYWNQVPSSGNSIAITANDLTATLPPNNTLTAAGTRNFNIILRTASTSSTITATDTGDQNKNYTTSPITVISGAAAKLVVVMPGETTAFGTTTGKTGTPNPVTAGDVLSVSVYALDANGNLTNSTDQISVAATNDNYASITPATTNLVNGAANFTVVFRTAGNNRRLTAIDVTDASVTNGLSPQFVVSVGAYTKILVVLPDQAHEPGSATGVSGTINIPPRGVAMAIRLIAVDDNFNRINAITNTLTRTALSDPLATGLGATSSFATGNRTFGSANFKTAGAQSATYVDDVTGFIAVIDVPNPDGATSETDQFRSIASGVWNNATSWESSADGLTWIASTLSPTSTAGTITVRSGHVVTINANLNIDQVTVDNGGQVDVTGGTLVIENGADAVDFLVNGILNNRRPITTTGVLRISGTGKYQHGYTLNGGTIPTATWDANSICEITGITSSTGNISGTNQAFSDFVWNTPNLTGSPSINTVFSVRNFTVLSTGSGTLNLGATASSAIAISGSYTQNDGNVAIAKTSGSRNITIAGNFNLLGGTFVKGLGAATVTFNGTAVQNFVKSSSSISGTINFVLNAGATLDFGTSVLDGSSGTFNAANGSAIITANANGLNTTALSGSVQVTGTRTFANRVFTYNGSVAQQAGDGLPLTFNSLTINNTSGVTLPATANTYAIANSLTINPVSASLNLGQNILSGSFADIGTGRIITEAANSGIPSGKTWTLGIDYGSASAQAVVAGNYKDFYTSNSGVKTTPSGIFNVAGNWSSAGGDVNLANTTLTFNGTTQSISDAGSNSGAGLLFQNVVFNNGGVKTLSSGIFSVATTGVLNVTGATTLNANGNLTLLSDASSTASVGQLTGGAQITGNVRANRFVTGANNLQYRTWRGFSSPVNSGGTYNLGQLIDNIIVTGTGGSANGFDNTLGNGRSAFTYNGSAFVEIPSTSTGIPAGQGVFVTYRGNRSNFSGKVTPPFVNPENTIVDFLGTLNQGTINTTLNTGSAPANLLGNPYAANISWDQLSTNNAGALANNFIRIWNPLDRSYDIINAGTGGIISSGQGFFVTGVSGATFTFSESVKVTTQPGTLLMSSPESRLDGLTLNEDKTIANAKVMVGGSAQLATANPTIKIQFAEPQRYNRDKSTIEFKSKASANYLIAEDLNYWAADSVRLATLSADGRSLAYNVMPPLANTSTVKLAIDAIQSKTYTLSFDFLNFPSGTQVQLVDHYLNTSTTLTNSQSVSIHVDKNVAASFGNDRLSLSFGPANTLPVEFADFQGKKTTSGVLLTWNTKSESKNDYFEILRAGEDKVFTALPKVAAKNVASTYSLVDSKPLKGNNYYQLRQVDYDGKTANFDKLVSVYFDGVSNNTNFVVYPNPVVDVATVKFEGALNDRNVLKVMNTTGQNILSKTVSASEINNGMNIDLRTYAPGLYVVELLDVVTQKRLAIQKIIKR